MKYVLLIYDEERTWGKLSPADQQAMMAEYRKFSEEVKASGQYVAGSQLHPVSAASSVRVREGKRLVTDGPFAETREQLGGYYLIEAANLDAALDVASKIPAARLGTVEVRPLINLEGLPENDPSNAEPATAQV